MAEKKGTHAKRQRRGGESLPFGVFCGYVWLGSTLRSIEIIEGDRIHDERSNLGCMPFLESAGIGRALAPRSEKNKIKTCFVPELMLQTSLKWLYQASEGVSPSRYSSVKALGRRAGEMWLASSWEASRIASLCYALTGSIQPHVPRNQPLPPRWTTLGWQFYATRGFRSNTPNRADHSDRAIIVKHARNEQRRPC